jgi:hypothetical protein
LELTGLVVAVTVVIAIAAAVVRGRRRTRADQPPTHTAPKISATVDI